MRRAEVPSALGITATDCSLIFVPSAGFVAVWFRVCDALGLNQLPNIGISVL